MINNSITELTNKYVTVKRICPIIQFIRLIVNFETMLVIHVQKLLLRSLLVLLCKLLLYLRICYILQIVEKVPNSKFYI